MVRWLKNVGWKTILEKFIVDEKEVIEKRWMKNGYRKIVDEKRL